MKNNVHAKTKALNDGYSMMGTLTAIFVQLPWGMFVACTCDGHPDTLPQNVIVGVY